MKLTKSQITFGKWFLLIIGLLIFCHYLKKKRLIEDHSPITDDDPWFTITDIEKYCGTSTAERYTLVQQHAQGELGTGDGRATNRHFQTGQRETPVSLRFIAEAAERQANSSHAQMEAARTRMQDEENNIAASLEDLRYARTSCQTGTR